jgi:uncharacterized protein
MSASMRWVYADDQSNMEFTPLVYLIAPLVVFAGYVAFGISGFGSTIIIVPVLAQLLPLKFVVPLLVLLDLAAAIMMRATKATQARDMGEIRSMLPFMLIGMALGAYLLKVAPERWLMLALGVFVTGYALITLMRSRREGISIARWWCAPVALLGGTASSLFGTGGPIYAIYVSRRLQDPSVLRATMGTIIAISVVVRVVIFLLSGLLLKMALGIAVLALVGFMAGGMLLGMRLHSRMKVDDVRRVVHVLLLLSGSSLAVRAIMMTVP